MKSQNDKIGDSNNQELVLFPKFYVHLGHPMQWTREELVSIGASHMPFAHR